VFLLSSTAPLNAEEAEVLKKIENYFKPSSMSIKDKVRAALIIAEHELESEQYGNEREHQNILFFYRILGRVIDKL